MLQFFPPLLEISTSASIINGNKKLLFPWLMAVKIIFPTIMASANSCLSLACCVIAGHRYICFLPYFTWMDIIVKFESNFSFKEVILI